MIILYIFLDKTFCKFEHKKFEVPFTSNQIDSDDYLRCRAPSAKIDNFLSEKEVFISDDYLERINKIAFPWQ